MNRIKDKVAVVTGGASGIGLGIVKKFVDEGAKVVFTDINQDRGSEVEDTFEKNVSFLQQDVSKEDDWIRVINDTLTAYGQVDIVVNCAGVPPAQKPIEQISLEQFQKVIDINLTGTFLGIKHGFRAMKSGNGGSIINISSLGGLVGIATGADYNASKGGVRLMTKGAALDAAYGHYNIRVNSVHPGYIKSNMIPEESETFMNNDTPLGHMGLPKDVASACLFLASDESTFITGTELVVDGGVFAK